MTSKFITLLLFSTLLIFSASNSYAVDNPLRIVSLAPSITTLLEAAGAKSEIVGVTNYSTHGFAKNIAKVGPFGYPNVKKIAALKPDLIFITQKSKSFCDKPNSPLAHLGVPIIVIHDHDLMTIGKVLERIGKITGTYPIAEKAAQHLRKVIKSYQSSPVTRLKPIPVFIQIHNKPLYTAGTHTYISEMVRLCGGENIIHSQVPYFSITPEQVVLQKPVAILDFSTDKNSISALATSQTTKIIPLFRLNPDYTLQYSPKIVKGLQEICHTIQKIRGRL